MKYILSILIVGFSFVGRADTITSTLNNKAINISSKPNYSFIVSGHFYGGRTNQTGYPTNTLLANLDWINNSNAKMVICLGDLFMDVKNDIPKYKLSFFSKLNIPLFNAVGNHDISGSVYNDNFGETYYYFQINNDIHLVLDTELNDGNIENEQLDLLNRIKNKVEEENINNVFIYTHRTIWAKTYPDLDNLFNTNTQSKFGNNFKTEVLPLIRTIQNNAQVYFFSGSLGDAPASFFNYEANSEVKYIATAIRGLKRDAVLIVNSNEKSQVSFEVKSFTNSTLKPFESYNLEFWNKNIGKPKGFNYRLVPLYIKQTIFSYSFWFGILLGVLFIISVKRIFKK